MANIFLFLRIKEIQTEEENIVRKRGEKNKSGLIKRIAKNFIKNNSLEIFDVYFVSKEDRKK